MLKRLLKKKTAKKVWIILGILIIPAFLLWGLDSGIRSPKEPLYVGKIFGKSISSLEYQDALLAVRNQSIIQLGEENFHQLEKYLNLPDRAWDRLVLLYEAKRRKINVTDREVIELIQGYPFFQRNGKFDARLYEQALRYIFHTPSARLFEEQTRQNLILAKLYRQVTDSLNLNDEEIKEEYRKLNEEISIDYIASLPSDFLKDIAPSEQELKTYYAKNQLEFKQPLSFNIEYVSLESEDKLKNILWRLNKKKDFNKVAKELDLEIKETGPFTQTSLVPGIGWSPEILSIIAKLKEGQFSPPLNLDNRYYILRLKERKEPYIPDFETIKEKVKEIFIKKKSQEIARKKIESCLKKLKEAYKISSGEVDFNRFAKESGLKSDSTSPFKYGSYIEGIGASDNFWIAAQQLKEGEFSQIIDMGPAGFYIIKLKSKTPIDEKNFATEKEEFTQRLLEQKRQEYFTKFVEELKRKAHKIRDKNF